MSRGFSEIMNYYKDLKKYKEQLTKQQYKTIKGQIIAGDKQGAMKGLNRLLKRGGNNE